MADKRISPVLSLFAPAKAAPSSTNAPPARTAAPRGRGPQPPDGAVSVSQAIGRAKGSLDALGELRVFGELGRLTIHAPSGHWYFDIKDKDALLKVVMYARDAQRMRFRPQPGQTVVVEGRLTVYATRGEFQMTARQVLPVGEGELALAFEQLKKKLEAEGLFDPARRRRLPLLPRAVGIVTSLQAAALQDVLTTLRRRMPSLPIVIASARVQGEGAPDELATALARLGRSGRVDVVLLVRGGGAAEDLQAFNSEVVARAVVACAVPVVSGVGHETDTTIADFVADLRAPTPTAAAMMAVPDERELRAQLDAHERRLTASMRGRLAMARARLQRLDKRLPVDVKAPAQARLDELSQRLDRASPQRRVAQWKRRVAQLHTQLIRLDPRADVVDARAYVDRLAERLRAATHKLVEQRRHALASAVHKLEALSPLQVMQRGWALVTVDDEALQTQRIVRADDLVPGASLHIRVLGGQARATVDADDRTGAPNDDAT